MEDVYKGYLDLLRQLGRTLEQLTEVAEKKMVAAKNDDLMTLDECIKQEQVLSLSLRSFERRQSEMLGQLGLSKVTLSGLSQHVPEDLQIQAKDVAEEVQTRYSTYISASQAARTTLECALRKIEMMCRQADIPSGDADPAPSRTDIRV